MKTLNEPGKYDAVCTTVRKHTGARGAIVIIVEGKLGSGFSIQSDAHTLALLPEALEQVAKDIRENLPRKLSTS